MFGWKAEMWKKVFDVWGKVSTSGVYLVCVVKSNVLALFSKTCREIDSYVKL